MSQIGDDVIDLRDLWKRYEEVKEEYEQEIPDDFPVRPLEEDDPATTRATCNTCFRSWDDAVITSMTPAPSARCPFEYFHIDEDELEELKTLEYLFDEIGPPDKHGEFDEPTLIRDGYFEEYAQQLAEDIGAIPEEARWPAYHIDWAAAAADLQQDYTSYEIDGHTYWQRA